MDHSDLTPLRIRAGVSATALVLATLSIYVLRLNGAAGLMVDDAFYVLLAKALAEGEGYRLINSGTTAMLPLYPPGFPAILSFAFHVAPRFPQNVWLLKSVSIAAMMGVGLLTYVYVRHRHMARELAACVAVAVTITPAFVFLATSTVMSECVFTFSQLATVLLIHRSVETTDRRTGRRLVALGGLLAAMTVLIRSAGAGLVVAAALWFLKERLWRRAALFGAVVMLCLVPWVLYARSHAPTLAERVTHGGSIVYAYGEQVWMRWAGDPSSGKIALRDLPARGATNMVDVFGRGMGGILMPTLFRGANESGEEMIALGGAAGLSRGGMGGASATMAISFFLSGVVLLGLIETARKRVTVAELLVPISLGIVFVWPFWTFRFVVPLTPYFFLYVVVGIQTIAAWLTPSKHKATLDPLRIARIALLCIIGLNLSDHAGYILQARDSARSDGVGWLAQAREVDAALDWMNRNLEDQGVIATTNPGLVYLRTGRKTVSLDRPIDNWSAWRKRGVRYIVCLLAIELPPASPGEYKVLYQSPSRFWIIGI